MMLALNYCSILLRGDQAAVCVNKKRKNKREREKEERVSGLCLPCSQPASCSHLAWPDL